MVRRLVVAAAAASVIAGAASPALAGIAVRRVDMSHFPSVEVVVASDDGRTLSRADVGVVENHISAAVTSVTPLGSTSGGVDAVLAIDVSNSMRGRNLATALAAAKLFVSRVPSWIDVGVVAFSDRATVVSPVTRDRTSVTSKVERLGSVTRPGTALFDAVLAAAHLFTDEGQHNLIIVTDGKNTSGTSDLQDAIDAAYDAGMTVDPIGLAGPQTDETTLRALASATGGEYQTISPRALDAVYASIARRLARQYVVRYVSKAPRGVSVDITVSTPGGSATVHALTPPITSGATSSGGLAGWLYSTNIGMLLAVMLTFLAACCFMGLVTTTRVAARRDVLLRGRLAAQQTPIRPDVAGSAVVIPRHVAQVAEWGARATGVASPIERLLERASWRWTVGEFFAATMIAVFVVVLVGGVLVGNVVFAVVAAALAAVVPYVVLSRAARKRADAIQAQLSDVLMVLASALRAGHSFLQALDTVAKEVGDPAASEFGRALAEMRLGRPVDDALNALVDRVGSQDLEWAVTAISIQRRVGGNLAEVLETLAGTIRERETLRRQMRVLSSEGRLSVLILTVLPFLIGFYIFVVNPIYAHALTGTKLGVMLIIGGSVLMVIGYVWMKRIVRLDV